MQITEELIRQLVVEVVEKLEAMRAQSSVSRPSARQEVFGGKVLSAWDVESYFRSGVETVVVSNRTIITPLARERVSDLGLNLEKSS
jgi:hypothetical protein